jgi:hypothetical protein
MEIAEVIVPKKKNKIPVLNELAPAWPSRLLVAGASGSGKTNCVLQLLDKYLPWETLQIVAKHLDTPGYQALRKKVEADEAKKGYKYAVFIDDLSKVTPVDDLCAANRCLTIFDDFIMSKDLEIIEDYYVRSRHKNVTCIFLTQSVYRSPKTVRLNSSHYILFKGLNGRDLTGVHSDIAGDMRKEDFIKLYHEVTKKPFGFIVVDGNPVAPELRFRIGFDRLVIPPSL